MKLRRSERGKYSPRNSAVLKALVLYAARVVMRGCRKLSAISIVKLRSDVFRIEFLNLVISL